MVVLVVLLVLLVLPELQAKLARQAQQVNPVPQDQLGQREMPAPQVQQELPETEHLARPDQREILALQVLLGQPGQQEIPVLLGKLDQLDGLALQVPLVSPVLPDLQEQQD